MTLIKSLPSQATSGQKIMSPAVSVDTGPAVWVEGFNLYYGSFQALLDVNLSVRKKQVTAIIGPSGCGKSTLLRALNRMNDMISDVHVDGQILIEDKPGYGRDIDLIALRKKVGMVFQR